MAAAQARKHVFVEKPFTLTRASAEGAIEAVGAERDRKEHLPEAVRATG